MAKAQRTIDVPRPPIETFHALGHFMNSGRLKIFAQEGWTFKSQENFGFFRMGYPANVTASVLQGPNDTSRVEVQCDAFGWGPFASKALSKIMDRMEFALRG